MTLTDPAFVVGSAAAGFALLGWLAARQRQPFTLKRPDNSDLVRLTRARRPTVQIRRTWVYHRGDLSTNDFAGTAKLRTLGRDQSLILSLRRLEDGTTDSYVQPSEVLQVQYRRLWPWYPSVLLGRYRWLFNRFGRKHQEAIFRRYSETVMVPPRPWKQWTSSML